jgi:hypothetical protein
MMPEEFDRYQRTRTGADTAARQPRNDVVSWQNRSGNGATGRTTEIPATKAESVDVQEQDRLGAALTTDAGRKPFSMSYGGLSSADYIRYRMSRGMR